MHPSTSQSAAGSPAAGRGEPDPLTRLPTRRQFLDRLGEEIGALESGDGTIAVLLVDIDGFRRVNRDLGHVDRRSAPLLAPAAGSSPPSAPATSSPGPAATSSSS